MLEAARERGARLLRGKVVGIGAGERVRAVEVAREGGRRETLEATHVVLAAGPMQRELAQMIGVALPLYAERHHKVSFADTLSGVPREAPMLIWLDAQHLPWSAEERAALEEDEEARWLLGEFPAGVHGRPDGAHATLLLFNHHGEAVEPVFPLPEAPPHYAEITLRAMSTMVPGLQAYAGKPQRPYVDGGYYMRTRENRPLIGPVPVEGAYVSCGFSGFGVMASCASGELIARHITGGDLPDYAPAFLLSRYQDPDYCAVARQLGRRRAAVTLDPRRSNRHEAGEIEDDAMDKFTRLEGVAAPLKMINVDTDMIIPKNYLKTIKRTGLGKGLFAEKRYNDDGSENPDFVLNKPAYRNAKIIVADDNFGCGSSREHAPWALLDYGIRCVISTSFGDIFYNNCFKNGILPIKVSPEDLEKLFDDAERGANATLSIDLEKQEIRGPDGGVVRFEIDPFRKHCLLNGLDDVGLTMVKKDRIDAYEDKAKAARPWV